MDKDTEFDNRIAEIYWLGNSSGIASMVGDESMDIRHAEFQAMAESFLGADYDSEKLERVEKLQIDLHAQQSYLLQEYENKRLEAEAYVDAVNFVISSTFAQCELILGKEDFEQFFGDPRGELAGFIDKEIFLALPTDSTGTQSFHDDMLEVNTDQHILKFCDELLLFKLHFFPEKVQFSIVAWLLQDPKNTSSRVDKIRQLSTERLEVIKNIASANSTYLDGQLLLQAAADGQLLDEDWCSLQELDGFFVRISSYQFALVLLRYPNLVTFLNPADKNSFAYYSQDLPFEISNYVLRAVPEISIETAQNLFSALQHIYPELQQISLVEQDQFFAELVSNLNFVREAFKKYEDAYIDIIVNVTNQKIRRKIGGNPKFVDEVYELENRRQLAG